jgi:hypothetical protein
MTSLDFDLSQMPSKDFKGKKKTGTESLLDTIFAHLPSAQNIYKPTTPGITRGDDNINLVKRASGEGGAQKKVTNKEDKIKKYAKQIDFIHERMIDDLADQAYEQHMAAVANELGPLCDGIYDNFNLIIFQLLHVILHDQCRIIKKN